MNKRFLTFPVVSLLLLVYLISDCQFILSVKATSQGGYWGQNNYLTRNLDIWEPYKKFSFDAPSDETPYSINTTGGVGTYLIDDGWISQITSSATCGIGYNWLFGIWGSGTGIGKFYFEFWKLHFEFEIYLFTTSQSDQLTTLSQVTWQYKEATQFSMQTGDRLILKLYLNVTSYGTFSVFFDGQDYSSYVNDPTETRYMRSNTQLVNGLTAYQLGTSQSVSALSVSSQASSISLAATLYPTSDSLAGFPNWLPISPTTHYDKVDDVVADDDTTVVFTDDSTTTYYDRYGHTAYGGASTIAYVKVTFRAVKYSVGARRATFSGGMYIGTTYYAISSSSTGGWKTDSATYYLNPATNLPWTTTDITNLKIAISGRSLLYSGDYYYAWCTQIYLEVYTYTDDTIYYSVSVSKRDSGGTETGIETNIASWSGLLSGLLSSGGLKSATGDIDPQVSLVSTDSIVVKVYQKIGSGAWNFVRNFTTEPLGAQSLDAVTWTVYYYLSTSTDASKVYTVFTHGTTTYNSRIENFQWTVAAVTNYVVDLSKTFTFMFTHSTKTSFIRNFIFSSSFSFTLNTITNYLREFLFQIPMSYGAEEKFEYQTESDSSFTAYGDIWYGETFTPQINHNLTKIVLFGGREGEPSGNFTVSIRNTDVYELPIGEDLISKSFLANSIPLEEGEIEILFDTQIYLETNTKYAIILRCPNGNSTNLIYVTAEYANPYPRGAFLISADNDTTWNLDADYDLWFEEWGTKETFKLSLIASYIVDFVKQWTFTFVTSVYAPIIEVLREIFLVFLAAFLFTVIYEVKRDNIWSGILASLCWVITSLLWFVQEPQIYAVSLLFSGLGIFYIVRTILDLFNMKRARRLGAEEINGFSL